MTVAVTPVPDCDKFNAPISLRYTTVKLLRRVEMRVEASGDAGCVL
jgi:hypothetical protein